MHAQLWSSRLFRHPNMGAVGEKNNFALVPKTPAAVEKRSRG